MVGERSVSMNLSFYSLKNNRMEGEGSPNFFSNRERTVGFGFTVLSFIFFKQQEHRGGGGLWGSPSIFSFHFFNGNCSGVHLLAFLLFFSLHSKRMTWGSESQCFVLLLNNKRTVRGANGSFHFFPNNKSSLGGRVYLLIFLFFQNNKKLRERFFVLTFLLHFWIVRRRCGVFVVSFSFGFGKFAS